MKVLVYRKCSTCMKALKWLDEHNISYEERAIKEENPTYEELKEWYTKSGLPLKKFFNTSGMLYKEMGLKDKLKDMSEDEQLKLLATDGMLVKRPLVIGMILYLQDLKKRMDRGYARIMCIAQHQVYLQSDGGKSRHFLSLFCFV